MLDEREHFMDFDQFPWFRRATIDQLFKIERLHDSRLYWPNLDVDLDLDRIQHPEKSAGDARLQDGGESGAPLDDVPPAPLSNSGVGEGPRLVS